VTIAPARNDAAAAPSPSARPVPFALPGWLLVTAGFAVSRVVTSLFLAAVYAFVSTGDYTFEHYDGRQGFIGFLESWDSRFYHRIAVNGYPDTLPREPNGDVGKSAWAFLPLYPLVVRAVIGLTGLGFPIAGMLVSIIFGGAAAVALHHLIRYRFGNHAAMWGALFFCFGPLSFVLQVAYAESLFLFCMFVSVIAMMKRRYLLMIPFAVAATFTHPGGIALAAALGVVGLTRLLRGERLPRREWMSASTAILSIVASTLAWPLIASAVTGYPSAYFDTELAWWRDYIETVQNFVPFSPWFMMAEDSGGWVLVVLVAVLLAATAALLARRSARALGTELWAYTVSYITYLVAVFLPQQSIFRMLLLPLSPLLGHPVFTGSRTRRVVTLSVSIALQPIAMIMLWVVWPP